MSPDCNWLPLPVQVKCHDDVQSGVACIAQLNLQASSFINCVSCEMALNLVSEKITQFNRSKIRRYTIGNGVCLGRRNCLRCEMALNLVSEKLLRSKIQKYTIGIGVCLGRRSRQK